jgi:sugar (pentulose or hexulose) kinase
MSLLGIDVGTTGAKAIVLSEEGKLLASVRREYNIVRPQPGWAELDSSAIWRQLEDMIREAAAETAADPVVALSYFRQGSEHMATAGIAIKELRATGGGGSFQFLAPGQCGHP